MMSLFTSAVFNRTFKQHGRHSGIGWYLYAKSEFAGQQNETTPKENINEEKNSKYEKRDSTYEDDIKNKILATSMSYVNELGWSKSALGAGAKALGYPGISHGLFPRGGGELVDYFQKNSNKKLVEILKEYEKNQAVNPMAPAELVEKAIQRRLEMVIPYIRKWPQALAVMTLPPNVPNALAAILTIADDICYYAGDRSVDFNWYTRRIGVAGVYKATELYLIQDSSPDYAQTWRFLHKRLEEAIQIHALLTKSNKTSKAAKDGAMSAFITARNILGLNWNR